MMMKSIVIAKCFVLCQIFLFTFGQPAIEFVGQWMISPSSLLNSEDTFGESVSISVYCYGYQTSWRFFGAGLDYLMFEDPNTVSVLYRTDDSGIESLQWEPGDEADELIVSESYTDTWVGHLINARELTMQVTAGGYEHTHTFDVSELREALQEASCK
jgi:hypothetical protein